MFQGNLGLFLMVGISGFSRPYVRDLTTNRENKGLAKIKGFTVLCFTICVILGPQLILKYGVY
jgi:hypothetical protein